MDTPRTYQFQRSKLRYATGDPWMDVYSDLLSTFGVEDVVQDVVGAVYRLMQFSSMRPLLYVVRGHGHPDMYVLYSWPLDRMEVGYLHDRPSPFELEQANTRAHALVVNPLPDLSWSDGHFLQTINITTDGKGEDRD